MAVEFWIEMVTNKSFEKLIELSKKYKMVVIGGWAAYLLTNLHKSKDIDIIVDYDVLFKMKKEHALVKNERLKKYEIKAGEFDIDIYLPSYSKLMLPIKKILSNTQSVNGIRVPKPEVLVILKQGAEIDRRNSIKGKKDLIDILALLIYSGFDMAKYKILIKEENLMFLAKELVNEIMAFDSRDLKYIGLNVKEFSDWKKKFLLEFKK